MWPALLLLQPEKELAFIEYPLAVVHVNLPVECYVEGIFLLVRATSASADTTQRDTARGRELDREHMGQANANGQVISEAGRLVVEDFW